MSPEQMDMPGAPGPTTNEAVAFDSLPVARVEPKSRARLIWLVPILALVAVATLVIQEWRDRGPLIEVEVPRASGLESGRTAVVSQGVRIGLVEEVRLDATLEHPIVVVRLHRWASAFARKGSLFWVVRPSIGFRGVSGLETLTSGPVLEARPGPADATWAIRFVGLTRAPTDAATNSGLRISLSTARLGSIRAGSTVTYRDIDVGEVTDVQLSADAKSVVIAVTIGERYAPLVRAGSRFWNTSGFGVDLGMTGLKLRTESLESMIGGGIALATPSASEAAAKNGDSFDLAPEPEKDWLRWAPAIELAK